mgnify:FL=1
MLTVSTLAMMISVFALYILAPIGFTIFARGKNANKINKVASAIGIVSFLGLTALFTLPKVTMNSQQITLFFEANSSWFNKKFTTVFDGTDKFHTLLNAVMLSPLGLMSVQHSKASGKKHGLAKGLILGLITGATIETLQWALPISRVPDIYDIMLNTAGAFLGATGMTCIEAIKSKLFPETKASKQKSFVDAEHESLTNHLSKSKANQLCENLVKSVESKNVKNNALVKNLVKITKPQKTETISQPFYPTELTQQKTKLEKGLSNTISKLSAQDSNVQDNKQTPVLGG